MPVVGTFGSTPTQKLSFNSGLTKLEHVRYKSRNERGFKCIPIGAEHDVTTP